MRPKISATASSVPTLDQPLPASSSIPETAQVATPSAAAETSTRSKNLIVQILLEIGWYGERRWRGTGSGAGEVRGAALARCGGRGVARRASVAAAIGVRVPPALSIEARVPRAPSGRAP